MKKKLIIYGASGHGKVAADIARLNGYTDIVFFDDDVSKKTFGQYDVIHSFDGISDYDLFIAIGANQTREMISKRCDKQLVTLIHPSAVIANDTTIGQGVIVMANAVINSGSRIGNGTIINTCSSIDHDNRIADFCHISVGAHTAGSVNIEERVFLGAGSIVINNVSICKDVTIGAGGVAIHDIKEAGVYVGVPAVKK